MTGNIAMLAPYRVLDLCDLQGQYAAQLLGSLGADVIKIEPPEGDALRRLGPFYHDRADLEASLNWWALNLNKRGVTLDVTRPQGQEILKKLVAGADIVIESFRPGYLDGLGLGYDALSRVNPGVILASITPFGHSGPYRDYHGSDLVAWAMGGLLAQSGDPDMPPVRISHINLAYMVGSLDAAWGALIALWWRGGIGAAGRGQHVDVSLQESVAKSTFLAHEYFQVTGQERSRGSSSYRIPWTELYLRTVWQTRDGYLYFMIHGGEFGSRENPHFLTWMEEEGIADDFIRGIDWMQLDWKLLGPAEIERIQSYFAALFRRHANTEIVAQAFKRHIVLQTINAPREILANPQLEARRFWQPVNHDHPDVTTRYPGRFCLFTGATDPPLRRAPHLGEHNAEIYAELGLDATALKRQGVA